MANQWPRQRNAAVRQRVGVAHFIHPRRVACRLCRRAACLHQGSICARSETSYVSNSKPASPMNGSPLHSASPKACGYVGLASVAAWTGPPFNPERHGWSVASCKAGWTVPRTTCCLTTAACTRSSWPATIILSVAAFTRRICYPSNPGCGRKPRIPGGSSCIPTKIAFEPLSSTSSWANASDPIRQLG